MTSAATMDAISKLNAALAARYEVEREIGRGGMATVYLARRPAPQPPRRASRCCTRISRRASGPSASCARSRSPRGCSIPHILPLYDSGAGRRSAVLRDAVRRGRVAAPAARAREAPADRRGRAHRARGCRRRSTTRIATRSCIATSSPRTSCSTKASRGHRLRHRQGGERGGGDSAHADGDGGRHAGVHEPGAGRRRGELDGRSDIYSLGCDALRDARGRAAVHRAERCRR